MSKTALQKDTHQHEHVHGHDCGCGHDTTYVRKEPKVGRNEPCPCGSGKKFKKCCGSSL